MKSFLKNITKLAVFAILLSSCNQNEADRSEHAIGHELKNVDGNFDDIIQYLKNRNSHLMNALDPGDVNYRVIRGKRSDCVFVELSGDVLHRGSDMIACKSRKDGSIMEL